MQKPGCAACKFLHAAGGNWRNAIFIECTACPYERQILCNGFLLTPDADGKPIILPAAAFQNILGVSVEKAECVTTIDRRQFESLYSLMIEWQVDSPEVCSLNTLAGSCICRE